jgi:hypothetical protein
MRLALHDEMPPEFDEGDYLAAWRWPVLVQGCGLARMTVTSRGFISAAKRWFNSFVTAPEAIDGMLCCYRAEPPIGYEPKKAVLAGTLYAPSWQPAGWVNRDAAVFGKRLIQTPKAPPAVDTLPAVATDSVFDNMAAAGALLLPPQPATHRSRQHEPELGDKLLDDTIPF